MKITWTNVWMGATILVLAFFLWDAKCGSKEVGETVEVPIKEKAGKFKAVKPESKPIPEPKIIYRDNPTVKEDLTVQNDTVNERLFIENVILRQKFKSASDSLKLAKYDKAIELNDFDKTLENDTIKIYVFGKSRGTVEDLGIDWKIKPSKEKATIKTWRVLGSFEAGSTIKLDKFGAKPGLIYQSANGRQYFGSYQINDRVIWVGTAITIFKKTK